MKQRWARLRRRVVVACRAVGRFSDALRKDTDTYVFGGLALIGAGLWIGVGEWVALAVVGALALGLGVWLSVPARPRGEGE